MMGLSMSEYPSLSIFTSSAPVPLVIVVGNRGSGKTQAVKHFAREAASLGEGMLVYDLIGFNYQGNGVTQANRLLLVNDCDAFCNRVLEFARKNRPKRLWVVIEELSSLSDRLGGGRLPAMLDELIFSGRNYGVALILITHRPSYCINPSAMSQADWIVCFGCKRRQDRKYLADDLELDESLFSPRQIPQFHSLLVQTSTSNHWLMKPVPM